MPVRMPLMVYRHPISTACLRPMSARCSCCCPAASATTATRASSCTRSTAPAATATRARAWRRLIPPLAGSDYLADHRAELPCLLRNGQNEVIVVNGVGYHNVMPGNKRLSPAQLTNLLNYIESHWGNEAAPRTIRDVQAQLDSALHVAKPASPVVAAAVVPTRTRQRFARQHSALLQPSEPSFPASQTHFLP